MSDADRSDGADDWWLVLSALGADRPGIVAELTRFLRERGANVEDSRMAIFGAEFGILVLVSAPPTAIERIVGELGDLATAAGLAITHRRTRSPEALRRAMATPCLVVAEALDREGIVLAVAAALHKLGLNIASLETSSYHAPETGAPLFRLEARVELPRDMTVEALRQHLVAVGDAEAIDVEVKTS